MSRSERLPSPHFAISSATISLHNSWVLRRALATQEQELGPNHPNTATSLNNLALLYHTQGKYTQAEPLYQRALAICEQTLGTAHPTTQTIQANYTTLLRKMKQGDTTPSRTQRNKKKHRRRISLHFSLLRKRSLSKGENCGVVIVLDEKE